MHDTKAPATPATDAAAQPRAHAPTAPPARVLGFRVTPLTARRFANFKRNRRGYWSLWIFVVLFLVSLFSEFIANDRPLLVRLDGKFYAPVLFDYTEEELGGDFPTSADYHDPFLKERIAQHGWAVWPLIEFDYRSVVRNLPRPAPSPPSWLIPAEERRAKPDAPYNLLGTDDQARDVAARILYGFRISVLFGFALTIVSSIIGIAAGAVQGFYGGWVDLLFQRFIEVWGGLPQLFLLIILASIIEPSFWILLVFLLLFSWMGLVGVVRAEFLRVRNFDYVRAARALGVPDWRIMARHILPNAMVATLTFLPFILSGSVTVLASLGELVQQGKNNLTAPWLGLSAFVVLSIVLVLLIFVGEAVRDAFDPRKLFAGKKA
ncbi:MAG: ABC transporter permease [Alphaproteobacteria bacterium]|nr:ABC transporter permease [Alphaproteobacteria bacterium]